MSETLEKPAATFPIREVPPDHANRRRILEELDKTMLVEAAAGTGKTTCMIGRMVALLRAGTCQIDSLAAVSFTRKSTAELRARFQIELERNAAAASSAERERLADALRHIERCFIGTIDAFCCHILRERPMEAGVDLAFRELDEVQDRTLREQAWDEYVARLYAENAPLLAELDELGLAIGELQPAFVRLADYPDVHEWPAPEVELPYVGPVIGQIRDYAAHMEAIAPTFPVERGNDKLMDAYERLSRLVRQINTDRVADVIDVLAQFRGAKAVQKMWPGGAAQAKREQQRYDEFVTRTAEPLWNLWLERRYAAVIRVVRPAMEVYARRRRDATRRDGAEFSGPAPASGRLAARTTATNNEDHHSCSWMLVAMLVVTSVGAPYRSFAQADETAAIEKFESRVVLCSSN